MTGVQTCALPIFHSFVALSAARMKEWMGADLSALDIMVVQIDGVHISEHLVLVAALGIDSQGFKHPLGPMEGQPSTALWCRR